MRLKNVISAIAIFISIILMITPFGVSVRYWATDTQFGYGYYSYFDLYNMLGGGNMLPILIGLISIWLLIAIVLGIKKGYSSTLVKPLLTACILMSIISYFIFNTFTTIALIINILQVITLILSYLPEGKNT